MLTGAPIAVSAENESKPQPTATHAESLPEPSYEETEIEPFDREHWSYLPVADPDVPHVTQPGWARTSIDRFILAALEKRSLTPAKEADRNTLARRVAFDLTGLPPSRSTLQKFLSDDRPGAYERFVEQLLASPQYGRRWGQYWLDLARFAETDGYEHDKIRTTAWRYRDWVVNAFNADIGYDDFVSLQIAGDVIRPDDPNAEIATAFCLSGPDMPDINSQDERKHVLLNEVTSTIGSTLLSLQVGCAQCHDHKYDAISQADFYRLRAFFDPAIKLKANRSVTTLSATADPNATSHFYVRGDWRRAGDLVHAAFPRIVNPKGDSVTEDNAGGRRVDLASWLVDPSHPLTGRSIVNRVWQQHFGKGLSTTPSDFGVMGQEPSHPELLDYLVTRLTQRDWSLKDLHREILRSSVYRTQSRLEFEPARDSVHAEAWQKLLATDPDNRWLGRFPRRRLDAESIRDAMLHASGALNHEAGGPGVSPPLPEELIKTLKKGQWQESTRQADHFRRSIYIFARRNLLYPMFATFDRPAANCSCAVRHSSTTAVQSLLLLNSKITLDASERLVEKIRDRVDPESGPLAETARRNAYCREIFLRTLSREPSRIELSNCTLFLDEQIRLLDRQGHADPEHAALVDLCRAIFNSNPFLYVD